MKYSAVIISTIISLIFTTELYAQDTLSLNEAIRTALENNYNILTTELDEDIASLNNSWGNTGRVPTITFDTGQNNSRTRTDGSDITTVSINPGINLRWVLFDGFGIKIRKQRLESLEEMAEGNTALVVENTVQAVILAYYRVLFEQEKLHVFNEVMDLSRDRYDYEKTRRELGNAVTYDVLQAQNAWLEDRTNFLQQEVAVSNAYRDLLYIMGIEDNDQFALTDEFTIDRDEYERIDLQNKMLASNKTLQNQYINEVLRERETALARSAYYPSLSLNTGADKIHRRTKVDDFDTDTSNSTSFYANLTLSFNLFNAGNTKRAVEIARIREEMEKISTTDLTHTLNDQLDSLYDLYEVRRELLSLSEEKLEAARLNLQISEDKFRAGTINSFNYRDVQLIYLNSALGQLQAIFNLIDSRTALMRISGSIHQRILIMTSLC